MAVPLAHSTDSATHPTAGHTAIAGHLKATPSRLNDLFRDGHLPRTPLEGQFAGALLTITFSRAVDPIANALAHLYMPWIGKVFDSQAQAGGNLFTARSKRLIRPFYAAVHQHHSGLVYAHPFRTYIGPGIVDGDIQVLKIDYDLPANRFGPIRRVLDELVEIAPDYYLGKAHLRLRDRWHTVAYFTLRPA